MSGACKVNWVEDAATQIGGLPRWWHPVVGCTKISAGCAHCWFLESVGPALIRRGQDPVKWSPVAHFNECEMNVPVAEHGPRSQRRAYFVGAYGDIGHENITDEQIIRIVEVMRATPRHLYFVLTKRIRRIAEIAHRISWPNNAWLGISAADQRAFDIRWGALEMTPVPHVFWSLEPLVGPIDIRGAVLPDWVIVGGESQAGARPMETDWVRAIRDKCVTTNTPFYYKQDSAYGKGRVTHKPALDGRVWDELPDFRGCVI